MLAALLTLMAASPVAQMTEAQLDAKIAEAHAIPVFGDRIDALSRMFLGTSYGEFPLGEGGSGPEPQPRWRTDKVDCQTFVETVMAMANANNVAEAKKILDDIRYANLPPTFDNRNHFTEAQWLPANMEKGYIRDEAISIDGNAPEETLVLHKAQWAKVKGLERLATANVPEGKFNIRYLRLHEAKARKNSIETGTIIMVVRAHDPNRVVRVSHMGFIVKRGGQLAVRHASTTESKTVLDEPFDYFIDLQSKFKSWPVQGVALVMPLDAQVRAGQIAKSGE